MATAQNLPPTRFDRSHPVLRTPPVWHPQAPRERWSVVLLRRRIQLSRPVRRAWLWVSASQRFILYLNGRELARGPSRSDPMHWGCVRVPLGNLSAGQHVLAARSVC